jgi:hypothetical protein
MQKIVGAKHSNPKQAISEMQYPASEDTTLERMLVVPQPLTFVPIRRKSLFPALGGKL